MWTKYDVQRKPWQRHVDHMHRPRLSEYVAMSCSQHYLHWRSTAGFRPSFNNRRLSSSYQRTVWNCGYLDGRIKLNCHSGNGNSARYYDFGIFHLATIDFEPSHMPLTCSCQQLPFQVIFWSDFIRCPSFWTLTESSHILNVILLDEARMRNDNNLQSKRTNKSLRCGHCEASLVLSCDRFNIYLIIILQVLQNSKCFTTLIVLLTKLQRGNLRYSTLTCIDRISYVPMHKRSDKWRGQPLGPRILLWNIMTILSVTLEQFIRSVIRWSSIHYFWPFLLVIRLDSYSVCCHLSEATTMTTSDVS